MGVLQLFDEAIADTTWYERDYREMKKSFESTDDKFERVRIIRDFMRLQSEEVMRIYQMADTRPTTLEVQRKEG